MFFKILNKTYFLFFFNIYMHIDHCIHYSRSTLIYNIDCNQSIGFNHLCIGCRRVCVCVCACLSDADIVSKRLHGSSFFAFRLPSLCFREIKVSP